MSLLSRLFGSRHSSLDDIRKASRHSRWADVLTFSSAFDDSSLVAADLAEFQDLVNTASENLALINFEEGLATLRTGDMRRGMEHLDLALQLVRSDGLRQSIEAEFSRIGKSDPEISGDVLMPTSNTPAKTSCTSSCCGSSVDISSVLPNHSTAFDEETRFDIILTAYPMELRSRYLALSLIMRQAILFAHEENTDEALKLFSQVKEKEFCDIYYYETGTLYARLNRYPEAVKALQQAIGLNPGFAFAAVTLIDLHLMNKNYSPACSLLFQMLNAKCMSDYCHARLFNIYQAQGDFAKAYEHACEALRLGHNDSELIIFVAQNLEDQGKFDEAENVLSLIPTAGGCSGGANVPLADFWVRHKKNLQKSLEMFKNAAKSDPKNPLWGYHIARVYLALGWKKDANQILEKLINSEILDSSLRENAVKLLKNAA